MDNDDRNPPAEREVQVNEKPTIGVAVLQKSYCPYDRNGNYIPPGYEIER
jgi:hypothetical protein